MKKIFFNTVLSQEQMTWLAKRPYGFNRYNAFLSLLEKAVWTDTTYKKKGYETLLRVGQVAASEVELSKGWKCNRRTVARFILSLNQLGIISTTSNNRTSIHSLLCLNAWIVDGKWVKNPLYVRPNDKVHTSLPQKSTAKPRDESTQPMGVTGEFIRNSIKIQKV